MKRKMINEQSRFREKATGGALAKALSAALGEREDAEYAIQNTQLELEKNVVRLAQINEVIENLERLLSLRNAKAKNSIQVDKYPVKIHDNIAELFSKKTEKSVLSPLEVFNAIQAQCSVDLKQVQNALSYMAVQGKLLRVGRGRYTVSN